MLVTARIAVVLAFALAAAACADSGRADAGAGAGDDGVSIVATTGVLADAAREVAGDSAQITTLMRPGADPHTFEASAKQLAAMQDADLIIANGGNLEEHLRDALAETARAGVPVFHATDHIETLALDAGHDHDGEVGGDLEDAGADAPGHTGDAHTDDPDRHVVDPHFWTDPTRVADVARALGEQLGRLTGEVDATARRADDYAARVEQVDARVEQMLAAIPDDRRTLVTNHEAFAYFADRYGFTVAGTVIPSLSTGAEPSAKDLEQLADTIARQRVPAVFIENTAPSNLAETLAAEAGTGVRVVELYNESLGEPGSGADTYIGVLKTNAERISRALTDVTQRSGASPTR